MKFIGILLIMIGILGGVMGTMMFGDIGVATFITSTVGLLSGIGFLLVPKKTK